MAYENNNKSFDEKRNAESIFSKRIKAGKRRTYFFDVRETRGSDYFITITESKKRFNDEGYDRHKMFIYKEDFNKFLTALTETVDYVKTDLMPDFDFDAFNHDEFEEHREYAPATSSVNTEATVSLPVAETTIATEAFVESSPLAESIQITGTNDDTDVDAWKI